MILLDVHKLTPCKSRSSYFRCGKTTQIPQFILEEAPLSKIIVAQPRRLAATGVASRVALERGESEPGKASVGYVVRGDSKICGSTRLMFCTTGVLLRQLQAQNALENITHILVDEVHERHLGTNDNCRSIE